MPKPFLLQCTNHTNGQHRWLSEWHDTEREAYAAKDELEAMGWQVHVTAMVHPPQAQGRRSGLACGGQFPLFGGSQMP